MQVLAFSNSGASLVGVNVVSTGFKLFGRIWMSDWDAGAGALIKGNEGLMFRLVSHMNCSNNFLSKTIFATCSQG